MRDNVIKLKVVLASGDIVKTGSRARKSAAGYDLTCLMIGSEGTLGVITEPTLRLQKIPQHSVFFLPWPCKSCPFIVLGMGMTYETCRVDGNSSCLQLTFKSRLKINASNQVQFFFGLLEYHSDCASAVDGKPMDVCVPLSHLAELISTSKKELDSSSLVCTVITHAGDGNFHTVVSFDLDNDEQRKEAERLNHFMVHTALAMEGTCTGEHGVGTGKMKYLEKELGMEALQAMKKIRVALDPNNIMNPGKLIPPHVCL